MQKSFNKQKSKAYYFRSSKAWVKLLGLRPNIDHVYLRYAIVQFGALFYVVVGFYVAGNYDKEIFDRLTGLFIGLFMCFSLIIGAVDFIGRRK